MFKRTIKTLTIVAVFNVTRLAQPTPSVAAAETQKDQEAAWKAVDSRPTPAWWRDAKFGIFIHWGPYAVPAFSRVGHYSEWYWRDLTDSARRPHATVKSFYDRVYGDRFAYPDFVPFFTCELRHGVPPLQ